MKLFANTNIGKRIIIALSLIISISFLTPKTVEAKDVGGSLMKPICNFLVGVGDGFIDVLHTVVLEQEESIIRIAKTSSAWKALLTIGLVVLIIVAGIGVAALTGGIASVIVGYTVTTLTAGVVKTIIVAAGVAGFFIYNSNHWGNEMVFPMYTLTPDNIFSNQIPLFDVNFINPKENNKIKAKDLIGYKKVKTAESGEIDSWIKEIIGIDYDDFLSGSRKVDAKNGGSDYIYTKNKGKEDEQTYTLNIKQASVEGALDIIYKWKFALYDDNNNNNKVAEKTFDYSFQDLRGSHINEFNDWIDGEIGPDAGKNLDDVYHNCMDGTYGKDVYFPCLRKVYKFLVTNDEEKSCTIQIYEHNGSNDMVDKGEGYTSYTNPDYDEYVVPLLMEWGGEELLAAYDAACEENAINGGTLTFEFNGITYRPRTYLVAYVDEDSEAETIYTLYGSKSIGGISYQLKGVISGWYRILRMIALVGMMSVLMYIGIRILIASTASQNAKYKEMLKDWLVAMILLFTMHYIMSFANTAVEQLTLLFKESIAQNLSYVNKIEYDSSLEDNFEDANIKIVTSEEEADMDGQVTIFKQTDSPDGKDYLVWKTDLMGTIRMQAAQSKRQGSTKYIGYTIMFLVLIIYTVVFCYTYIKRVVYMAFLTLIAPLVALTYPIDKINDGSAQGFKFWFREYIFNLLLQPLHFLLYIILISSAIKLATEHMVYALVALGFIATAEKIVRQIFNFQKASTPGGLSVAAGAALTMEGMRKLMGFGPKGGPQGRGGNQGGSRKNIEDSKTPSKLNKQGITERFMNAIGQGGDAPEEGSPNRQSIDYSFGNGGTPDLGDDNLPEMEEPGELGGEDFLPEQGEPEVDPVQDQIIQQVDERKLALESKQNKLKELEAKRLELINGNNGVGAQKLQDYRINTLTKKIEKEKNEIAELQKNELNGQRNSEDEKQGIPGREMQQQEEAQKDEERKLKKLKRYIKDENNFQYAKATYRSLDAGLRFYGRGMKNKIKNRIKNSNPVGNVAKALAGGAVAATVGTVGLATGIASGDPSKAAQYTGITALAGHKLGIKSYESLRNTLTVEGTEEAMKMGFYGDEYKEKMAEKFAEEYGSRESVIQEVYNNNIKIAEKTYKNDRITWSEAVETAGILSKQYGEKEGIYDPREWKKLEKFRKRGMKLANGRQRLYTYDEVIGARMAYNRYFRGNSSVQDKELDKIIKESNPELDDAGVRIIRMAIRQWDDIENE